MAQPEAVRHSPQWQIARQKPTEALIPGLIPSNASGPAIRASENPPCWVSAVIRRLGVLDGIARARVLIDLDAPRG